MVHRAVWVSIQARVRRFTQQQTMKGFDCKGLAIVRGPVKSDVDMK